jgi:hypothetical protein
MRWHRAARVLGLVALGIVLLQAAYFVGCVDGTTPDCSDAATQCGPDIDATDDHVIEAALPETAPPGDASDDTTTNADADADAQPDADLDAGDGG